MLNHAHEALSQDRILFGPIYEGIIFRLAVLLLALPLCLFGLIGSFLLAFKTRCRGYD
jgi:hypothetical protein